MDFILDRTATGVGPMFAHRADGTGIERPLVAADGESGQIIPSRDGRWIVTRTSISTAGQGDIFGFRMGDTAAVPLVRSAATETLPALSPDGPWLAYASNESGTAEVYVRPFPETGTAKWQVSTAGGRQPLWARSGRELFYVNNRTELVVAQLQPGAAFAVGEQRVLFSTAQYAAGSGVHGYAVTPDDQRFLVTWEDEALQESELVVAQHWLAGLKGRLGQ
ncbi:hypothetical protein BH24GEM1_BH24GEM1_30050 [soil metagenome]